MIKFTHNQKLGFEKKEFKGKWKKANRRYFKIADITIQVESDLPFSEGTFHSKFKDFEVKGALEGKILIRHYFSLPDLEGKNLGYEVYRQHPWLIYKNNDSWIYLNSSQNQRDKRLYRMAIFNAGHTRARIYDANEELFQKGKLYFLASFFPDQVFIARVLADRYGCYLHSCGVNFQGKGLLFAGHSGAGKTTLARMLKKKAEILCDERIIIRKPPTANPKSKNGFRIYGTWNNGGVQDVSANSVPLKAVMFLEKADDNLLIPIEDKKEITRKLLAYLIKPFVTVDWWEKTLSIVEKIAEEVPCYTLRFDKSGKVVDTLRRI